MHRLIKLLLGAVLAGVIAVAAAIGGLTIWWNAQFPPVSSEVVQLTAHNRLPLERLRAERKFRPYDFPPFTYGGVETPEEGAIATKAVNDVIDAILARPDGPLPARAVSDLIGDAMSAVSNLATEDRDRTASYLVEIWYLLGFKGATGRFIYASSFRIPPGYGEPLPPGWTSPTEPRQIGEN